MEVAMPVTFSDREQAFEAKFAHDEELRFLAVARRDKLFGRWAANRLRSSNEETEALVKAVLGIPNGPGHDQALLQHIAEFLSAREAEVSAQELSTALDECRQQALRELMERPPFHSGAV
jgi:hypothetical protein